MKSMLNWAIRFVESHKVQEVRTVEREAFTDPSDGQVIKAPVRYMYKGKDHRRYRREQVYKQALRRHR